MYQVAFFSDQALGESGAQHGDGLGFDAYAQVLASAARETEGPFTMGIFGEWGTGKTSLMRLVQRDLARDPRVVTVWFNAWRFEREEHPIVPLVATLVKEIEARSTPGRPPDAATKRLLRALRAIAYGFAAKASFGVPGLATIEASFAAKDIQKHTEREAPDSVLDRSLYYDAFSSIEAVDLGDALRVVVIIDDLDRCFPDKAVRLLESIKLVLAQQGFIFILGVARQVLEGYLQHRYQTEYGIKEFPGAKYLDKIVQLPFDIPPNTGRMRTLATALLSNQPDEVRSELAEFVPIAGELCDRNPRSLIRLLNNILIDAAISARIDGRPDDAPIPLRILAISRLLKERAPDSFDRLTASPELAQTVATWDRANLADIASGSGEESKVAAALLANRDLADLVLGEPGLAWLHSRAQREQSVDFLAGQRRTSMIETRDSAARYDVFLSYSRADREAVVQIVQFLSDHGLRTFFDGDILVGEPWADQLQSALRSSRAVCICIGAQPLGEFQARELEASLLADSLVVPVILTGAHTEVLPQALVERQWLDLREGITPEALTPLLRALDRAG